MAFGKKEAKRALDAGPIAVADKPGSDVPLPMQFGGYPSSLSLREWRELPSGYSVGSLPNPLSQGIVAGLRQEAWVNELAQITLDRSFDAVRQRVLGRDWPSLTVPSADDIREDSEKRICAITALLSENSEWDLSDQHRNALQKQRELRLRARRALDAGYEPTTPPRQWYAGFWRKAPEGLVPQMPMGLFPSASRAIVSFTAPAPKSVAAKYEQAKDLFGHENLHVYSPSKQDFDSDPAPLPKDPVLIGAIQLDDQTLWFEVARWDVAGDLAALYEQATGKTGA